ncbi:MAG: TrbI/VirB10 family protein [Pseudobdellovibrionaceae bacterium]
MEVNSGEISAGINKVKDWFKGLFFKKTLVSKKIELNLSSIKWMGIILTLVFICVIMLLPEDVPVQFTARMAEESGSSLNTEHTDQNKRTIGSSKQLWAAPRHESYGLSGGGGVEINYNTSMLLGASEGNAKTQLRSGTRLPLRILDKVIVSQDSVPVLAELLLDGMTESGLRMPAGTKFYGEASFTKGAERAQIIFKQISLPNGQIKNLTAKALGKDGHPGIPGRIYSDGAKNTAGQVLTTFVGGLAAGSVQTDVFGRSKGGLENGLLNAVAETARSKAQSYGENLKTEREWIEIQSGTECDALLSESMDLQYGGHRE